MKSFLSPISEIIDDLSKGKMVVIVDDENRENEGDLIFCGSFVSSDKINFMAKYARGLICLALDKKKFNKLKLKLMTDSNQSKHRTAFTVSIEARKGVTTGISAKDRAHTIKVAVSPKAKPSDLVSPGHIFPLLASDGGVLVRAGHTEAAVDLSGLATSDQHPYGVICEIMNEDGTMAKGEDLFKFAKKHKLAIAKIDDLISFRLKKEKLIKLKNTSSIVVQNQKYIIKVFESVLDGSEHFALLKGKINLNSTPRVRVISSNVVQNYLINQKLPNSFNKTLSYFKKYNNCVLVFIRDPNLKSVSQTLKQYKSKEFYKKGFDKLIKNYGIGAQIIKSLKIKNMILVTRSTKKVVGLEGYGIRIQKQEIIK